METDAVKILPRISKNPAILRKGFLFFEGSRRSCCIWSEKSHHNLKNLERIPIILSENNKIKRKTNPHDEVEEPKKEKNKRKKKHKKKKKKDEEEEEEEEEGSSAWE